jgi:hypothetical protein
MRWDGWKIRKHTFRWVVVGCKFIPLKRPQRCFLVGALGRERKFW